MTFENRRTEVDRLNQMRHVKKDWRYWLTGVAYIGIPLLVVGLLKSLGAM